MECRADKMRSSIYGCEKPGSLQRLAIFFWEDGGVQAQNRVKRKKRGFALIFLVGGCMMRIGQSGGKRIPRRKKFAKILGVLMDIFLPVVLALGALMLLWLYAIAPQMKNRPDFSELAKYDYAHRGLHNAKKGIPENTLKAFRAAAEAGFGMEFDLQLTKDKQVVVHHDESLLRTCGVDKKVSALTLDELRQYPIANTDQVVPTLQETLDAVGRRVPLIVEIKGYQPAEEICPLVWEILKNYRGVFCVESFDPVAVKWFRDYQPQIVRGQLMENLKPGKNLTAFQAFAGRNLLSNFLTRPNFEAYDYHARKRPAMWVARKIFGMQEVSWTVKDWETYYALKRENCMIIFEGFEPIADVKPAAAVTEQTAQSGRPAPVNIAKQ